MREVVDDGRWMDGCLAKLRLTNLDLGNSTQSRSHVSLTFPKLLNSCSTRFFEHAQLDNHSGMRDLYIYLSACA
jgi:hypothetical protein